MKKLIVLITISFLPLVTSAQYQSIFGDSSTAWNSYYEGLGYYLTDSVYTAGIDTNFNGHIYKELCCF